MHGIFLGLCVYLCLVVLQIVIFGVIFVIIAGIEYLYKKYKERQLRRRRETREEFLTEKTVDLQTNEYVGENKNTPYQTNDGVYYKVNVYDPVQNNIYVDKQDILIKEMMIDEI